LNRAHGQRQAQREHTDTLSDHHTRGKRHTHNGRGLHEAAGAVSFAKIDEIKKLLKIKYYGRWVGENFVETHSPNQLQIKFGDDVRYGR